ncbi:CcoQ/FixQ family Cbb3-type cytochrome c oxidase assembly chaperone [Rhodobacterales bacterium HKCCE2091]|nr:CcoQ/FixQ family Cbb3-type cytochrome c oxidase assembly chaperone [Rhodobacterales bacterium HKCCE2091]
METYTFLRAFADTWGLLGMFLFFIGAVVFAFSRSRAFHDDAARVVFRHDEPAADTAAVRGQGGDAAGTRGTISERAEA